MVTPRCGVALCGVFLRSLPLRNIGSEDDPSTSPLLFHDS